MLIKLYRPCIIEWLQTAKHLKRICPVISWEDFSAALTTVSDHDDLLTELFVCDCAVEGWSTTLAAAATGSGQCAVLAFLSLFTRHSDLQPR